MMDNSDNPIIIYNSHYFLYIMFYHNLKFTSSTGNHLISPHPPASGCSGGSTKPSDTSKEAPCTGSNGSLRATCEDRRWLDGMIHGQILGELACH
jgi:hypothetical protein